MGLWGTLTVEAHPNPSSLLRIYRSWEGLPLENLGLSLNSSGPRAGGQAPEKGRHPPFLPHALQDWDHSSVSPHFLRDTGRVSDGHHRRFHAISSSHLPGVSIGVEAPMESVGLWCLLCCSSDEQSRPFPSCNPAHLLWRTQPSAISRVL